MPLKIGARLGPYEILTPLGAGGMGEVYKARDTRLDRTIAIKVLPSETSNDPELRARFEREAQAIAALDHPHICALHDVGEHDGVRYLVMQHLEGETLASRLARANGPLPLDQVLKIAIEIADALDKAHRAGITHRDLKPANIMLTRSGTKLLDFGLAKLREPSVPVGVAGLTNLATTAPDTAHGTILGTLHYMAPEQVEGRQADARSDIWALGAVIYETATGKRPFGGESPASIISAILRDVPPPISTAQPLSPQGLEHVVATCLMKDPDDRWQSAADIVHELKWAPAAATLPRAASRRSYAAVAWTVAALAVLGAGVALMVALRRPAVDARLMRFEIATPPSANFHALALSLDGRSLAFVADHDDASHLWVRRLDQAASRPLPGTNGATFPFWSPDGRALGFFAGGKLKRIDLPDGVPQVLADAVAGRGGTWNTDGVIVFAPGTVGPLMRIPAAGGKPVAVTKLSTERGSHRSPQFLPDGRHFLFFTALVPLEARGTFMGSLDSLDVTPVLADANAAVYAAGALLFMRQSSLVAVRFNATTGAVAGEPITIAEDVPVVTGAFRGAFAASPAGIVVHRANPPGLRQLAWIDRSGKQLGTIGPPDENGLVNPALSPDEQRVMVGRVLQGNPDAWEIDVARGVLSRMTTEASNEGGPIWSPDGRFRVFYSDRNGVFDVFRAPAGGTGDSIRLTDFPESTVPQALSPDGQLLVYAAQSAVTGSDLWVMRMSGDRQASPLVKTAADDHGAQLSTGGKWLVYESNVSGRTEVYVQSFPTARERVQVSKGGGVQPRWRPDGRELFYIAPNGDLMAVPIATAADERALKPGVPVWLFRTRLVVSTPAPTFIKPQYAVARDGRFLMNVALEPPPRKPIEVVVNWAALLTQSAATGR